MSPKPAIGIGVLALALLLMGACRAQRKERQPRDAPVRAGAISGVDEFTASITHEINQPLGAILANVDAGALLWKQQPLPADELRDILNDIRDDVLRIRQIVHKLRTLLGKRSLEATVLDLNDVIAGSRGLLDKLARRYQVQLGVELARDPLPVMGDATHLQQVLANLATNGMEAMADLLPERRILMLTTEKDPRGVAVVMLADNGCGIAAGKLPEIFKVFYSTKPEGMGMGLAIVKTIVDAHGGRIDVGSHGQTGTAFRVSLPLIGPAPDTHRPATRPVHFF